MNQRRLLVAGLVLAMAVALVLLLQAQHGTSPAPSPAQEADQGPPPSPPALAGQEPKPAEPTPVPDNDSAITISVRVVGAETGTPIADAAVWIPETEGTSTTGESGTAKLELDTDRETEVIGKTAQGVWARATRKAGQPQVTLKIPERVQLAGTARWTDGEPAAEVQLRVLGAGSNQPPLTAHTPPWSLRRVVLDVTTDATGRFEVMGLADSAVTVRSATPGVAVLGPGVPSGAPDSVDTRLPNDALELVVASGKWVNLKFVDESSGDPIGSRLKVKLDPGSNYAAHRSTVSHDRRIAQVRFLWPGKGGAGGPVKVTASIEGYEPVNLELRNWPEGSTARIEMKRTSTENGVLRIRNPWQGVQSVWDPVFTLTCDGRLLREKNPEIRPSLAPDAWVFADLPPGTYVVKCNGFEFANAVVRAGEAVTADPVTSGISHLIVRPKLRGTKLSGKIRVITRSPRGLSQVTDIELDENGAFHVVPALKGKTRLTIMQGQLVSDPRKTIVEVPGEGRTVAIDVKMKER